MKLDRESSNIISAWWWTIDRSALAGILTIMFLGLLLVATASPAVAERIGLNSFYFAKRQIFFLIISLFLIITTSFLSVSWIRKISIIAFIIGILSLIAVLIIGEDVNGAKRWISLGGFSLQPSEFMKPIFVIITAWILSENRGNLQGFKISAILYTIVVSLLVLQPDFGMTVVVSFVWGAQMFVAAIPLIWVAAFSVLAILGGIGAYFFLPHVTKRIDGFLGIDDKANYQVQKSLEAFANGGIMGTGPGEGIVKQNLPDSHTDFIFAVAGEEMGAVMCLIIISLYAFIVFRGLKRTLEETDLFVVYSVSGLLMQFGLQAMVNIGVALNLLPTKGMTLPFVSYGGSSMMAISIAMGMMLALTRRRYGQIRSYVKL